MSSQAQAIVYRQYGTPEVLRLLRIDRPHVTDNSVLVRVRAASVNPFDWHNMTGEPWMVRLGGGLRKPKRSIPGVDLAGTVEEVGRGVTRFQPGDHVFGGCRGSFAEYVSVAETDIVHKPDSVTFEQAAAVPIAALTALQALRDKAALQPGHKVLINGAAGGVGTFAVQIARELGAEVTGVCSTRNVGLVESLGAHRVIDYTREDFAAGGDRYDAMIDNVGNRPLSVCRRCLQPRGVYVIVSGPKKGRLLGPGKRMLAAILSFMLASQRAAPFVANLNHDDLTVLKDLLEAGKVVPIIDREYALCDAAEAMRYLSTGHARAKIVVTL